MVRLLLNRSILWGRSHELTFETEAGDRFAVDATALQRRPDLFAPVTPAFSAMMYALELAAGVLILAGLLAGFLIAWWLFLPGLAAGLAMLAANRRTAARMAIDSAMTDNADFTYLYREGLIRKVR